MTPTTASRSPRDELLRRIGRNVVNFQYLEATLRSMIPALSSNGTLSDWPDRQVELVRKLKKSSLGDLATAYHKRVFQPPIDTSFDEVVTEPGFSFAVRLERPPEDIAGQKRALKSLVNERNRLIHNDLLSVDLESAEQCDALSAKLDEQNVRLHQELNALNAFRSELGVVAEELSKFIQSEEFAKLLRGEIDAA